VLGVFGLSQSTTQETIEDIFGRHGKIEKVTMIVDRQTQRSKGFGFVYFTDVEGATKAKEACNGMIIDGRKIRTDYSITTGRDDRRGSPPRSNSYSRDRYDSRDVRADSRYDRDDPYRRR